MSLPDIPNRTSIFIASSGQSQDLAEAVKLNFDGIADVDIWTENVFRLNEGTLQTLLNRASYYDFFIAVFAADDKAVIKGKEQQVTRDNVIFEFGLFLGRIGLARTFFLLEEGVDLFSDWNGISTARFTRRDNLVAAVGAACIQIKGQMKKADRLFDYTVLPSTALAVGYYYNFLKPVLDALQNETSVEIIEKNSRGEVAKKFTQEIKDHFPAIEIRAPRNLGALLRDYLHVQTKDYQQLILNTRARPFPFYVEGTFGEDSSLHLFDIPTTLLASYYTIKEFFSASFLAEDNNFQRLMDREIRNFDRTLGKLIPDTIGHKFYSFTVY